MFYNFLASLHSLISIEQVLFTPISWYSYPFLDFRIVITTTFISALILTICLKWLRFSCGLGFYGFRCPNNCFWLHYYLVCLGITLFFNLYSFHSMIFLYNIFYFWSNICVFIFIYNCSVNYSTGGYLCSVYYLCSVTTLLPVRATFVINHVMVQITDQQLTALYWTLLSL